MTADRNRLKGFFGLSLGAALCASAVGAQDLASIDPADGVVAASRGTSPVGVPTDPDRYGLLTNWTVIPATAFVPSDDTVAFSRGTDGYFSMATGLGELSAGIAAGVEVPAGALMTQVCLMILDNDAAGSVSMTWGVHELGDTSGQPAWVPLNTVASGGPDVYGYTTMCVPGGGVVIRGWWDADGDLDEAWTWYRIAASTTGGADLGWGGALLQWKATLSPAPATASFSDVPTDHPFFAYIEALQSSGITAGCGAGMYCPDDPITRGQMAVFVAKALGLYWPF